MDWGHLHTIISFTWILRHVMTSPVHLLAQHLRKMFHFFYPSVSLSLVLSSKFKLPEMFSFVKLRGSLAGTGSGTTDAYRTSYNYVSQLFSSSLANPTYIANPNLKPLNTTALELGADIRMFQSRFRILILLYTGIIPPIRFFQVPIDKIYWL